MACRKGNNNGAYFCSYPGFVDCYHIVCRMSERSGQPAFLMLCTLVDSEDVPLTEEARLGNYMDKLKSAIRSALRRGDSFTRYGNNQFLVLLVGIKQENCANPEPYYQLLFKLRAAGKDFCPL